MVNRFSTLALASALIITTGIMTGCSNSNSKQARPNIDGELIATVNGIRITQPMLDAYAKQRVQRRHDMAPELTDEEREGLIKELVDRELLYQDAILKGIDQRQEVAIDLENYRLNTLASAMVRDYLATTPPTEEDLKAEYDKQMVGDAMKEFKARHILLEEEKEARKIIKQLKEGAKFADLAKEHSTGPSATHGGDLGWFSVDQMVAPFAEGVKLLKKGEFSTDPVKTQFGWHVILLEDLRDIDAPPFDEVKEQLRMTVQGSMMENYVDRLRTNAKIEMK